jgi:hypothetical protein
LLLKKNPSGIPREGFLFFARPITGELLKGFRILFSAGVVKKHNLYEKITRVGYENQ